MTADDREDNTSDVDSGDGAVSESADLMEAPAPHTPLVVSLRHQLVASVPGPWSVENCALAVHCVVAGVVQAVCEGLLYGVLMGTMVVPGHVYSAAQTMLMAPRILRGGFGILSDRVPLFGYRRRSYAVLGWGTACAAASGLALLFEEPTPYYCSDSSLGGGGNYVPAAGVCNPHAADDAWWLVYSLALVGTGVVLAESAADGFLVQCARTKQSAVARGEVLSLALGLRLLGGVLGACAVGLGFNGRSHLGFFEAQLPLVCFTGGVAVLAAGLVVAWTLFAASDPRVPTSHCGSSSAWSVVACARKGASPPRYQVVDPDSEVSEVSDVVVPLPDASSETAEKRFVEGRDSDLTDTDEKSKEGDTDPRDDDDDGDDRPATWVRPGTLSRFVVEVCTPQFSSFVVFLLLAAPAAWFESPADDMVRRYWAHTQLLQERMTDVAVALLFAAVLAAGRACVLGFPWRQLHILASVVGGGGAGCIGALTALNIVRDQYLYQARELFMWAPRGCAHLLLALVVAEIAPVGLEATVYGISGGVLALAPLTARTVANAVFARLPTTMDGGSLGLLSRPAAFAADQPTFRAQVAVSLLLAAGITIVAALWAPLVPANAAAARISRETGFLSSLCRCVALSVTSVVAAALALVATTLALLPATSCEPLLGGSGCA